jgi:hypothetical protein
LTPTVPICVPRLKTLLIAVAIIFSGSPHLVIIPIPLSVLLLVLIVTSGVIGNISIAYVVAV